MKLILQKSRDYARELEQLTRASSLFDPAIERRTQSILQKVRTEGDVGLSELTRRFDHCDLAPDQFAVAPSEYLQAASAAEPRLRSAVATVTRNIRAFAHKSLRKNWTMKNGEGGWVGEKYDPLTRVGIYIPGGTAPLISTALMTVTLAKAAGCPEIVVCSPANKEGRLNGALIYAARTAGATEMYRLGGAQAIAAMAFGTSTVRRVEKVFGPGNAYVVMAKRLLFGYVAIDLLPGPSEILVLADTGANVPWIAADLLAQAEHGSGHERVWLISPSIKLLRQVEREISRQMPALARADHIRRALVQNGYLVQVKDLAAGIGLANRLAPEHCEIMTREPRAVAARIKTAGALFLGGYSPTVLGDYVAGPSHVLPTGGAGARFAGLTADQFQRRTSIVRYDAAALKQSLALVREFADREGLDAHRRSAEIRVEDA